MHTPNARFDTILQRLADNTLITQAHAFIETKDYCASVLVDAEGRIRTRINHAPTPGFPKEKRKALDLLNAVVKVQDRMEAVAKGSATNDDFNSLQQYFATA